MKVTKYDHACFSVEIDNQLLLIDPGSIGKIPDDILHTVAIVISHIHPDHLSKDNLRHITEVNPDAKIFTTSEVAEQLGNFNNVIEVLAEDIEQVGPFTVEFFGGDHAIIHESADHFENIGILINDSLYYPGDSFVLPEKPVQTLLVPASAPWLKISEAMDFISTVAPSQTLPTHDALLSDIGKQLHDNWLRQATEKSGGVYTRLATNESLIV